LDTDSRVSDQFKSLLLSLLKFLRAVVDELAAKAGVYGARAGKSAGMFIAAMVCMTLALVYLSIGVITWLSTLLSPAGAYLIVGGVLMASAAALLYFSLGRQKGKPDRDGGDEEETSEEEQGAETDT
jgi:hypothetical protein